MVCCAGLNLNLNCTCDLNKLLDCLCNLSYDLDNDVKLLNDARDRLKDMKEQMGEQIANKAQHGKLPTRILSGWVKRVEKLESEGLPVPEEIISVKEINIMTVNTQESNSNGNNSQTPRPPPTSRIGGSCYKNCLGAYGYQRRVVNMHKRVQALLDEHTGFTEDSIFVEDQGPAELPLNCKTLQGMDIVFNNVWRCLQDKDGPKIIGIHGMAGVGKTTLLKRINNNLRETKTTTATATNTAAAAATVAATRSAAAAATTTTTTTKVYLFDQVLWIDGLRGTDVLSVQFAICNRLGLTWGENDSQIECGKKIMRALNEKECILLIDDLRERLDFTAVGVPKKTKVVFTSRNKAACSVVEHFQLNCLEEEDAQALFQNVVGKDTLYSNSEIGPLAERVAQLCDGLPLTLGTVGLDMSSKREVEAWNHAIEMLKTQAHKFANIDKIVYNQLRVGYEFLDNDERQPCFLFCSLFPKGCLIKEENLVHYWFGENISGENNGTLKAIISWGKATINALKMVYLLKSGEIEGTITMHEMVRRYANWIVSDSGKIKNKFWGEYKATLLELPTDTNPEKVEKISLVECVIERSMILQCPNLSTLILTLSTLKHTRNDFFQSMENLKVLDLSGCNILVLQDITSLTNLQYLNLSRTSISALPDDFRNLEKLKYLDLSYMNYLWMIPPEVISNLQSLKFLSMYDSGLEGPSGGVFAEAGKVLMKELDQLGSLEDLGITIKSDDAFKLLQSSESIKCVHSLSITNCKELIDLPEDLKVLRVQRCSKLDGSVRQDSLHSVDIQDCSQFEDLDWLKSARNLRFLRIANCMKMKQVMSVKDMETKQVKDECEIECESSAEAEKRAKRKQVNCECGLGESLFSKLTHLHLENLPVLEFICGHDLESCVLEKIFVLYCPHLKKLPLNVNSNSEGALKSISGSQIWWNNLEMNDAAKSIFTQYFCEI